MKKTIFTGAGVAIVTPMKLTALSTLTSWASLSISTSITAPTLS